MVIRRFPFRVVAAAGFLFSLWTAHAGAAPAQPLDLPATPPVMDCKALASADISHEVGTPASIASAETIDGGRPSAYCKLQVMVDDYARFELHLPISAWTQRLLFGGGPGAQTVSDVDLDKFATVSWQDLGHRSNAELFADNYQYRINAAYRGMHLQVLAAKALIAKYYGKGPKFSYYNACSEPGREGMMEVQRFPEDFDGVGAGCPPINFTINNGLYYAWGILANIGADGGAILTEDKLPILHKAVLAQCDDADGGKDGILSDPLSCHPDVTAVECKAGQDPRTCLTSAQVHVAQEIYKGPHDNHGNKLAPIGALPGSELAWTAVIVPSAAPFGGPRETIPQTRTAIASEYSDPSLPKSWRLSDLKFDRATFNATTKQHYLFDATDPDLSAFAQAGHKLILWQALGDTNVLPAHAILYYTAMQNVMGAKAVDKFTRFYVLPGVYHCGHGDGPVISNLLLPLMVWVERGIAPGALPGVHFPQSAHGVAFGPPVHSASAPPPVPDLTRPIYPYPYTAKYIGTGNIRDAANYVEGPARPAPESLFDWLGADFYTPHYEKWCTADGAVYHCTSLR